VSACDDVDLLLAGGALGGFDPEDAARVRRHLDGCDRCARAAGEYVAAADALAIAVDPVEPSAELRARILRDVYMSEGAVTRTPSAATSSPVRSRRGRWAGLGALWRRVPSGRGFTLAGAAAALAALGIGVWAAGPGHARTSAAPVLSTPVRGTLEDLSVRGSFTWFPQSGTAVLSVRGLGQPGSRVYEVWLVRPSNTVTAVGFLTREPDGSWTAAMHATVEGYSAVAATLEPQGGSPRPTGQQVLLGMLPGA
jgi:anti-sigma-K factor RskA